MVAGPGRAQSGIQLIGVCGTEASQEIHPMTFVYRQLFPSFPDFRVTPGQILRNLSERPEMSSSEEKSKKAKTRKGNNTDENKVS